MRFALECQPSTPTQKIGIEGFFPKVNTQTDNSAKRTKAVAENG